MKTPNAIFAIMLIFVCQALPGFCMEGETTLPAKQFPLGYFYRHQKETISEKGKILAKIDTTLENLRTSGYGLIAKGVVVEKLGTADKVYPLLTVLDGSGLIIIVHNVPNIYYNYRGARTINPNIYLIVRNPRVNFPESYIRYSYVVEGEYMAYAQRFVDAIIDSMLKGGPMNYREGLGTRRDTGQLAGGP